MIRLKVDVFTNIVIIAKIKKTVPARVYSRKYRIALLFLEDLPKSRILIENGITVHSKKIRKLNRSTDDNDSIINSYKT
jgi:hypothetical protein